MSCWDELGEDQLDGLRQALGDVGRSMGCVAGGRIVRGGDVKQRDMSVMQTLRSDLTAPTCCEDQHVSLLPSSKLPLPEALSSVDETLRES